MANQEFEVRCTIPPPERECIGTIAFGVVATVFQENGLFRDQSVVAVSLGGPTVATPVEPWTTAGGARNLFVALEIPAFVTSNADVTATATKITVNNSGTYLVSWTADVTLDSLLSLATVDFGIGIDGLNGDLPVTTLMRVDYPLTVADGSTRTITFNARVNLIASDSFGVYCRKIIGAASMAPMWDIKYQSILVQRIT